ncbi:MAG: hypothetical protein WA040_17070 [Anaerolineae bacterium]|mgnify:CR=1 FL=1
MEAVSTIFTQIRTLVQPLSAEQRLQLIQDIAAMKQDETAVRETPSRAEQLAVEEDYWYGLPEEMRARYANRYVAIQNRQVVDHDVDQRALYLRVRRRFRSDPVAIVQAGWQERPVFEIHSPRLER